MKLIGNEEGLDNLAKDVDTTHGNESSFELLVSLNPDYIFILDRDSTIGAESTSLAQDILQKSELLKQIKCYQILKTEFLNSYPI